MGIWEIGRVVQIDQILKNAARHGARTAAVGNYQLTSGTTTTTVAVTATDVQTAVKSYLTANNLPTSVVNGTLITLTAKSPATWTDPKDAKKGDLYTVKVEIPASAYAPLQYIHYFNVVTTQAAQFSWKSANDDTILIGDVSTLPK